MFVLPDADHPDFLLRFVDEGYTQEQALEVPPDSGHNGIFPDAVAALTKQQWANVSAAYKSVVSFVATHPAVVAVVLLAQAAIAVYYFMFLAGHPSALACVCSIVAYYFYATTSRLLAGARQRRATRMHGTKRKKG
eukprot:SM000174S03347  [mRNA]  locus=s174:138887:139969:+ [translate_table: standard]